jgi:phage/plasmid primase-like uncharacterized protein
MNAPHDNFQDALRLIDLPALVADFYPDSGARPSSKKRAKAVWRGGDGESLAFWRGSEGSWHITDFARGEHYNAWQFLTDIVGLSKAEATKLLFERSGFSGRRRTSVKPARRAPKPRPDRTPKVAKADIKQWKKLPKTGSSDYLKRKGVASATCHAVHFDEKQKRIGILVSVVNDEGVLEPTSVQWINDKGSKLFAKGGTVRGGMVLVAANSLAELQGRVYLTEGYATAVSIHLTTGRPVVVAFSASNLLPVAWSLRTHCKKADVVIAADNDAYHTADKGNPGLEAAHLAALELSFRVTAPSFSNITTCPIGCKGGITQPTDFNDLYQLADFREVARQLEPQNPDPVIAFANERRRHLKKLEKIEATFGGYLPKIHDLPEGVTLIKAPQGSGKTFAMRDLIAHYRVQGLKVLYLTHRISLARDAATRLELEHYEDVGDYIRAVGGLTCCINSLPNLLDEAGTLDAFDVVIVDESEQLLAALQGNHIQNRALVLETLEALIRRAKRLVCMDADLSVLTYRMLQHLRPRERYNTITHFAEVGKGRTMRVHKTRDDIYGQLEQFTAPAFIVTNSKREAERIDAYLRSLGCKGRLITSGTSGSESEFIKNIDGNARAQGLNYVVCSPSVSTGVSLEGGYFKHVVGVFGSGVGKPSDALQALWRVRTHVTYDLWLDPTVRREFIDLRAKYGSLLEHEEHLLGRKLPLTENAFYEDIKHANEALEQHTQANYRVNFFKLATLQGFDFVFAESTGAHKGKAKHAHELAEAAYVESVLTDEAKAGTLAAIKGFYVLESDDSDTLRLWVQVDDRGRYRTRLRRLETALSDDDHLKGVVDGLLERTEMRADMPAVASQREFYRSLLKYVGLLHAFRLWKQGKLEQLDLTRYTKASLEAFRKWIEDNREWLGGLVALPSPEQLKKNMIRYVGSWLKALGLKQRRVADPKDGQYALEIETFALACETLERRGNLLPTLFSIKDSLGKSVGADLPPPSSNNAPPDSPDFPDAPLPPSQSTRIVLQTPPAPPDGWHYKHTLRLPDGTQKHVWEER